MSMKALLWTLIGVVSVLAVAVVVLVMTLGGIEDQRQYEACLARSAYSVDDPTLLDRADLDQIFAETEHCVD